MARSGDSLVPVLLDDDVLELFEGRLSVGSHGYAHLTIGGYQQLVHRYLLGLKSGDGRIGDHVNGLKLDNRRSNLRAVSASESSANVRGRGISGYRGVYPTRSGKWQAKAKSRGALIHLGTFATPGEAYMVSREWRRANLPGYVERAG